MSGRPAAMLVVGAVFASLAASYPFAIGDKNDLDTLRAVLPVARGTFVAARYLCTVFIHVAATALAVALAVLISAVHDVALSPVELGTTAAVGFAVFALLVAPQLPVYYAFGYLRARFAAHVPLLLLSGGVAGVVVLMGERVPDLDAWVGQPTRLVPGLVGGGLVLLGGSGLVSWRLDAARVERV